MLNRLNPIQNIDTSQIAHKYILRWQRPIVQRRKRCLSFCPSNERLGSMISEIPTQGLNILWMMFIFIFSLKMKILIVMAPTRFFKTSSWVTITTRQFSNIHVPHLIQIRCPSINILKSIMISTLRYFVIVMKMLIVYIITINRLQLVLSLLAIHHQQIEYIKHLQPYSINTILNGIQDIIPQSQCILKYK